MSDPAEQRRLHLFRSRPRDFLARSPLASSLQSFESSLFLLALQRYPHALTACAFAIESALKSAFHQPSGRGEGLQKLLEKARSQSPQLQVFSVTDLDSLRETRNRIVHYGFSPKDDNHMASLLLNPAIPLLRACYGSLLDFDLDDALLPEYATQIRAAEEVFQKSRTRPDLDATYCVVALGHLLRWSVKDSLMARWEVEAAQTADEDGLKFEVVERRKGEAEQRLEPCWAFDCPVCQGIETFVCQLHESELEDGRITLVRGLCVECGLRVPRDAFFLTDKLCEDQVLVQRARILSEYGIS